MADKLKQLEAERARLIKARSNIVKDKHASPLQMIEKLRKVEIQLSRIEEEIRSSRQ